MLELYQPVLRRLMIRKKVQCASNANGPIIYNREDVDHVQEANLDIKVNVWIMNR